MDNTLKKYLPSVIRNIIGSYNGHKAEWIESNTKTLQRCLNNGDIISGDLEDFNAHCQKYGNVLRQIDSSLIYSDVGYFFWQAHPLQKNFSSDFYITKNNDVYTSNSDDIYTSRFNIVHIDDIYAL